MTRKKEPDPPESEDGPERQERVLHTRVSERLEQELKDRAASLGVSVSNLVRNVLDNTFDLVEGIVQDSARVASSATSGWRAAKGASRPARPAPIDEDVVIGWQEIVLNVNAVCSKCNAILPRGSEAAIAIVSGSGDRPIVCRSCLEEIRDATYPIPDEEQPPDQRRKR